MNRIIAAICFTAAVTISGAAFAAPDYGNSSGQGNSDPGVARYDATSQNANPDAQCDTGAGSGAFGIYGKSFNLGIFGVLDPTGVPGANGYATGASEASRCGQRPSN